MQIKVRAFGQIAEYTDKEFTIGASSIKSLRSMLEQQHPQLAKLKYAIALNKKIVTDDADISENDEIALMPPYSGG